MPVCREKTGFELNIIKMGSWKHMGRATNMIIKDVSLENSTYFGDGDSINSNPERSCQICLLCYISGLRRGFSFNHKIFLCTEDNLMITMECPFLQDMFVINCSSCCISGGLWLKLLLTHKQLETHGCVISTLVTDVLVQKHQVISIYSAD